MLKRYPCFACLSELQLMMVLLITLNWYEEVYETTEEMLQDSACFTCLSDKQMLQGVVSSLVTIAARYGYTAEQAIEDIKCLQCATPKQVKAAIAKLMCSTFVGYND